jgi:hypothetical protein
MSLTRHHFRLLPADRKVSLLRLDCGVGATNFGVTNLVVDAKGEMLH